MNAMTLTNLLRQCAAACDAGRLEDAARAAADSAECVDDTTIPFVRDGAAYDAWISARESMIRQWPHLGQDGSPWRSGMESVLCQSLTPNPYGRFGHPIAPAMFAKAGGRRDHDLDDMIEAERERAQIEDAEGDALIDAAARVAEDAALKARNARHAKAHSAFLAARRRRNAIYDAMIELEDLGGRDEIVRLLNGADVLLRIEVEDAHKELDAAEDWDGVSA